MFEKYDPLYVYALVEDCLCNVSDKQYEDNRMFKKMEKSVAIMEGIKKNPRVKGAIRKEIDKNLKITDIAKKFGLEPDSKGKIHCPFHADGNPSCYLNDDKNIFHCFGCEAKGDIIEFYRRLKDETPGSS
jgi:phage terminase small subunit